MTAAETISLNIDEKAHSYAKIYSSLLSDAIQRKRAYASLTALYGLINLVEKTNYDIQKSMTLFRNTALNEEYEISDFYINNWHIDVRVITGGTAFLVPKSHFDNDIAPDYYAVIKIDSELKNAELLGFANTETMEKEGFDYHYFSVANSCLISYEEFLNNVAKKKENHFSEEDHKLFKECFLSLMDNELDKNTKNKIIKHLFECDECRTEFCCFTGFEMVSCNFSKYQNMFDDQTLNIIGAQAVDSPKYEGKEETIYIGNEPLPENNKTEEIQNTISNTEPPISPSNNEEEHEETVSDILDELFNTTETTDSVDISEKTVINDTPVPIDEKDKIELLEDNNEDLSVIEEDKEIKANFTDKELQLIEENFLDYDKRKDQNQNQDLVFIEEQETENLQEIADTAPELEIINDDIQNDELNLTAEDTENITPAEENIQKVIVDYDETGEPIYSYITNIPNEDSNIESLSETETLDDDLITIEDLDESTDKDIEQIDKIEDSTSDIEHINDAAPEEDFEEVENIENSEDLVIHDDVPETTTESRLDDDILEQDDYTETDEYEKFEDPLFANEDNSDNFDDEELKEPEEYDDNQSQEEDYDDTQDEYNEDENEEDYDEDFENNFRQQKGSSKKGLLLSLFIIILVLAGSGALFLMKYINMATNTVSTAAAENQSEIPENTAPINDMFGEPALQDDYTDNNTLPPTGSIEIPQSGNIEIPTGNINNPPPEPAPLTEQDLLKTPKSNAPTGDVNKIMSNAFASGGSNVSIRGVNWMCNPALFTNSVFKSYMQNLDNILKLNLRKNILDATEIPSNNAVAVKLAIDNNGNLIKSVIASSSGSDEIDNIVLQSINETLESQKTVILSDSAQKADKYFLQVVIKL